MRHFWSLPDGYPRDEFNTIACFELMEEQQEEIDTYPENSHIFFVDEDGTIHAIQKRLYDLFLAQGGPDDDWRQVIFT